MPNAGSISTAFANVSSVAMSLSAFAIHHWRLTGAQPGQCPERFLARVLRTRGEHLPQSKAKVARPSVATPAEMRQCEFLSSAPSAFDFTRR